MKITYITLTIILAIIAINTFNAGICFLCGLSLGITISIIASDIHDKKTNHE